MKDFSTVVSLSATTRNLRVCIYHDRNSILLPHFSTATTHIVALKFSSFFLLHNCCVIYLKHEHTVYMSQFNNFINIRQHFPYTMRIDRNNANRSSRNSSSNAQLNSNRTLWTIFPEDLEINLRNSSTLQSNVQHLFHLNCFFLGCNESIVHWLHVLNTHLSGTPSTVWLSVTWYLDCQSSNIAYYTTYQIDKEQIWKEWEKRKLKWKTNRNDGIFAFDRGHYRPWN